MKHWKEYKEGQALSQEDLDEITSELLYAKFKGEQEKKWAKLIEQKHNMHRTERPTKQINWWMPRLAAAVILALCLAFPLRQMLLTPSMPLAHLIAEHIATPLDNNTIRKGNTANISELRIVATTAYSKQNYAKAITDYEEVIEDASASTADYLYLGLSALYSKKNAKKAVRHLQQARTKAQKEESYEIEAIWFLALAYIQNNQPNKAYPLLETIVTNGNWQAEQAKELLLSIETLKK